MLSEDTIDWMSRVSAHRDTGDALCQQAARLCRERSSTGYDRGMLLYGILYHLRRSNGEGLIDRGYSPPRESPRAVGLANYAVRLLNWSR